MNRNLVLHAIRSDSGESRSYRVDRIQGANRLQRKGAASALDDLGIYLKQCPVRLDLPKPGFAIGGLRLGKSTHGSGADEDPAALDEGEM